MINNKICPASACYPGKPIDTALILLHKNKPIDFCIENWDFSHVQLCPQHIGFISEITTDRIKLKYPKTQFRLHANIRVTTTHRSFDAGFDLLDNLEYATKIKNIQQQLNAKTYSYHAPMRHNKSWCEIITNVLTLQDFLGIPTALEGLYPNPKNSEDLWKDSITAYEQILKSDLFFALDLSHLNIAYEQTDDCNKQQLISLTQEMLQNKNCIEVHISGNDGKNDNHKVIEKNVWWLDILNQTELHKDCVVFCESMQQKYS
jgi:hypothetical protein